MTRRHASLTSSWGVLFLSFASCTPTWEVLSMFMLMRTPSKPCTKGQTRQEPTQDHASRTGVGPTLIFLISPARACASLSVLLCLQPASTSAHMA